MKKIRIIFVFLSMIGVGIISCSDEDAFVSIDSLSSDGNEFYCNQKVKLWMCVKSSDLWHTDYQWSCDGGTLTQPQGLDEMTWQAPNIPGTYTVRCKVTTGGKSDIREHKMYVSSYFFDKFEKSPHGFSGQSSTTLTLRTENINGLTNGYLEAKVNSSSEVQRYIQHAFNDETLCTPFSVLAKIGFSSNMPTVDTIRVGTKKGLNELKYQLICKKDPTSQTGFIHNISFGWIPTTVTPRFPNIPGDASNVFNAYLSIGSTDIIGKTTTTSYYYLIPELSSFSNKNYKKVAMAIDKDYNFYVFLDGNQVLETNVISELRNSKGCEGNIFIDTWRILFPNGNGGKNIPLLYVDDAYASTTDILK